MRVLLNMVPDDESTDAESTSKTFWTGSNHLQPNELLGSHSIVEYILNNKSVTTNIFKNAPNRYKNTLFKTLYLNNSTKMSNYVTALNKYTSLYMEPCDVPTDLMLRSVI